MRITHSIDADALAAKNVQQERKPIGSVISDLPMLPLRSDGAPVDLPLVNSLRDELAP